MQFHVRAPLHVTPREGQEVWQDQTVTRVGPRTVTVAQGRPLRERPPWNPYIPPTLPQTRAADAASLASYYACRFTLAATRCASCAGVTKSTPPGASLSTSSTTLRASVTLCDHACTTTSE